jgi:hypothetical protein
LDLSKALQQKVATLKNSTLPSQRSKDAKDQIQQLSKQIKAEGDLRRESRSRKMALDKQLENLREGPLYKPACLSSKDAAATVSTLTDAPVPTPTNVQAEHHILTCNESLLNEPSQACEDNQVYVDGDYDDFEYQVSSNENADGQLLSVESCLAADAKNERPTELPAPKEIDFNDKSVQELCAFINNADAEAFTKFVKEVPFLTEIYAAEDACMTQQ